MINYVEHKDIDLGKWDRSLKLRNNENICLESWFLSAVCDRWDALVGDDYETIMPLPINQKYIPLSKSRRLNASPLILYQIHQKPLLNM